MPGGLKKSEAQGIADAIAGVFVPKGSEPKPKAAPKQEYKAKNKEDLAKTFKTNPDMDYNTKIRKMVGLE